MKISTPYTDGTIIVRETNEGAESGVLRRFECSACHELHIEELDAEDCCRPQVWEVFVCLICQEQHGDEDEAEDCCAEEKAREPEPDVVIVEVKKRGEEA